MHLKNHRLHCDAENGAGEMSDVYLIATSRPIKVNIKKREEGRSERWYKNSLSDLRSKKWRLFLFSRGIEAIRLRAYRKVLDRKQL
jgi:hypothetical protein